MALGKSKADNDESAARSLYEELLGCWNRRDAEGYAALLAEDGNLVGFDGSMMDGPSGGRSSLAGTFAHRPTAEYVWKVREVRFLDPQVAVLRSVAGMVPPGQSDLNTEANAVQTLVAEKGGDRWDTAMFQDTPAAFYGRPGLSEALTEELRQLLRTP
ncbi:MAG: SgcJ/EcaC family oxidoreductase [Dehalococcoidia bacterium]